MRYLEPRAEAVDALRESEDRGPVVMMNLLRFHADAQYPAGSEHGACSGEEAFGRYEALVMPLLEQVGGTSVWAGTMQHMIIGPDDKQWDRVLLLEYPSPDAFFALVSHADYASASVHRTAAACDARLIAMRPR